MQPINVTAISAGITAAMIGIDKVLTYIAKPGAEGDTNVAIESLKIARETSRRMNKIESRLEKCETDRATLHTQLDQLRNQIGVTERRDDEGNPPQPS